jgi:cobalt-zinc-cadmium efflux system outer membrane protein
MKYLIILFSFTLLHATNAFSQITLRECEDSFRQNNLLLLAEQYNINAAKAAVIQSRIWELPYLSGEFNAINPQDRRVLEVGSHGQKSLAVQQLIYLGGKKKNEIEFAKSNVVLAELQFEQLLLARVYFSFAK